jgi:sugar O-acyltransferase (sialic acid O-acetyltransferase NeuD family)
MPITRTGHHVTPLGWEDTRRMSTKVIGIGAGGHASVVIEILNLDSQYELVGLLDSNSDLHGTRILGVPVLGGDDRLVAIKNNGVERFFIGVGSAPDLTPRRRIYERATDIGLRPVSALHPTATISPKATIGEGATVMAAAVINVFAQIGTNVIVNTRAVIEHGCTIGNHTHIASGAIVAGDVKIGDETHVGAGAVIRQGITVGDGAIIGAGAVVVKDVDAGKTVVGNPAK